MKEGPDLLIAWMVGWRQAHLMSLRTQALEWSLPPDAPASDLPPIGPAYADFQNRMIGAAVALIEADTTRVDAADVPSLYEQYLLSLAQIIPQMSDDSLHRAVEPALAKLRGKSPAFAESVQNYTRATDEVLRWRNRRARAYARRHRGSAEGPEQLLLRAAEPDARVARGESAKQDVDQLLVAAPLLVEDVSRLAIDKPVELHNLAPAGQTHTTGRLESFAFGQSPAVAIPAEKIAALKRDLLVTPTAGPLSLQAAIAIHTAEHGYLQAIGGPTTSVELDPDLGRTINLPNDAHVPIGVLAAEKPKDTLRQLLWRVELKPAWLQHEYIFSTAP